MAYFGFTLGEIVGLSVPLTSVPLDGSKVLSFVLDSVGAEVCSPSVALPAPIAVGFSVETSEGSDVGASPTSKVMFGVGG